MPRASPAPETTRRRYADGCAGAHALDLVGERWALLVVRELLLGPKRFTDLKTGLQGISANVLTQRLEDLERTAILRRHRLPPPASAWVYELTDWGRELETVILELGRWGARSPALPRSEDLGPDSLILSFRTMFDSAAAEGFDGTIELRLGADRFRAIVRDGTLDIGRGVAVEPDAVIEGEAGVIATVAYDGREFTAAAKAGDLRVHGDRSVARRFLKLFHLPQKAAAPATAD